MASIGIELAYELDGRTSVPSWTEAAFFFLPHRQETSKVLSSRYPVDVCLGVKRSDLEAVHCPPSSAEFTQACQLWRLNR